MGWVKSFVALAAIAVLSAAAHAQSCKLPAPFQYKFENFAQLAVTSGASGCSLSATVNAAAPTAALAYVHYRRPPSINPLRFGFRLDVSAIASWSPFASVRIFAASARDSFPTADGLPQLVSLLLLGNAAQPRLGILVADNAVSVQHQQSRVVALTQVSVVRIELTHGSGASSGLLRYWINANYTDPPTGVMESSPGAGLDNSGWGAIHTVGLGLGGMSMRFRSDFPNVPVIFDQIESDDEFLFYDGFE
jgi:hypothetical protein